MNGRVHQEDPTKLKMTATQSEKDRTVTNAIADDLKVTIYPNLLNPIPVIQLNYDLLKASAFQSVYNNLKGQMKVTDGTNFMPTMDVVGRPGFQKITDGVKTVGGVYDNLTGIFSIATSRGAGKNTFTDIFEGVHVDAEIITPALGKRIMVVGIVTNVESDTGQLNIEFASQIIWRHYASKFKTSSGMDMNITGVANEPVLLNSPGIGDLDEFFVLVNYREID